MKRLIVVILLLAGFSASAQTCSTGQGVTCTPRLNLWLPPFGYGVGTQYTYNTVLNANWSILDAASGKLGGIPFCAGFAPTNGQGLQLTTASSPNPCWTAVTGGGSGPLQTCDASTVPNYAQAVCVFTLTAADLQQFDGTSATAIQVITAPGSGKVIWGTWDQASANYVAGTAAGPTENGSFFYGADLSDGLISSFLLQILFESLVNQFIFPTPASALAQASSGYINKKLSIYSEQSGSSSGSIATTNLAGGGTLFAPGDTFRDTNCDVSATGHVLTVNGGTGAILTDAIDTPGLACTVANSVNLTATSGSGINASINITAITLVNGHTILTIPYTVIPVQ